MTHGEEMEPPRNRRTPVYYRHELVRGLFERRLADGSKVYEAKYRNADGRVASKRLTTEYGRVGDARRELNALKAGAAPATGRLTLDGLARQALDEQRAEVQRGVRSPRGLETNEHRYWQHVSPVLGRRAAAELDAGDLRRLLGVMAKKGLAPATQTGTLNVVSAFYSFGTEVRPQLVARNPVKDLSRRSRPGTQPKKARRILSPAEVDVLLSHMSDTYRPVAALCAYLGLRISESLGIVWGDVDLQERRLSIEFQRGKGSERVRLKTPASRAVLSLPSAVVDELRAHRERQAARSFALIGADELVFPTGERNNARRAVAGAAQRAALGAVTPHSLRHSFVHAAHGAGLSIPAVASLARHKSPATTLQVYSTLGDEERLEAAKALEASGYGG